jgi:hypothetical protein
VGCLDSRGVDRVVRRIASLGHSCAAHPIRDVILRHLKHLDGERRYALLLFRLPVGKALDQVDLDTFPVEYIQCAGAANGMTVEIRVMSDQGAHQYTVGRKTMDEEISQTAQIAWDEYILEVFSNEVFDAEGAAILFRNYYESDSIPEEYSLRDQGI